MKIKRNLRKKSQRESSGLSNISHRSHLTAHISGITLVALVVTIVILLILAGISVSTLFGNNGIITKAQQAANETKKVEVITGIQLDILAKESENEGEDITRAELEGILTQYAQDGASGVLKDKKGNITGIKLAGLADPINITDIYSGTLTSGNNKTYTDSNGNTAVIPGGFYIVTGSNSISEGLVISDVNGDDLNNSKGGNQFVWIPVDGETLTYAQHTYATTSYDDHKGSTADSSNGNWDTYQYRNYTGWTDDGGNATSVAENGGFYIARFEAGTPESAPFFNNTDGSTYWQRYYSSNVSETYGSNDLEGSGNTKDYSKTYKDKNVTTYTPVSKKNTPSWNYISQTNAKTVSANMYSSSATVTSSLIDSYAWDTVTQWISDTTDKSVSDSTSWGNYSNANFDINGLYAIHQYKNANDGIDRWFPAYEWRYGTYTIPTNSRIETATGITDRNKANNIYDFAGNMYEWTTEQRTGNITYYNSSTGADSTGSGTFAVVRGGGCSSGGDWRFCDFSLWLL